MKQSVYTLPVVVLLALCTACTQADIVMPVTDGGDSGGGNTEEGVPLSVKNLGLSVEVETRSIVTGSPSGNTPTPNPLTSVGLCVTKKSSSNAVSVYATGHTTQVFAYNATKPAPGWELAEGEEPLYLYSEKGTVYGYAPSEKSVSLVGNPKEPVMKGLKVVDKQLFYFNDGGGVDPVTDVQWELDQEDYLYGVAKEQVDRWRPEVSLTMRHALAKVSFRILEEDGSSAFGDNYVAKVVMKSSSKGFKKCSSATLNLATGELGGTLTAVDMLTFTPGGDMRVIGSGTTEAARVPVQAFGLVIPVTGVGVTLELTLDDGRIFTMKPAEGSDTPGLFTANWVKGNNYIYNIRMLPQGIVIDKVEVAGWDDGGSTDVPVE